MRSVKLSAFLKSGFLAAFFSVCQMCSAASGPLSNPVSKAVETLVHRAVSRAMQWDPTWRALLHADRTRPQIHDRGFVLSGDRFSFESELRQTIQFLYGGDPQNVCRFPARYLWIQRQLDAPSLPLAQCSGLMEFLNKAPADRLDLVFASENLAQPSSMMGHLFLKLSGKNAEGANVDHAVTFFTDAATINIPKLLFDSVVTGKEGFFALSPFRDQLDTYVNVERRGLWQYTLHLDEFHRRLIQYHLWELKQTEFRYFFQSYNCATLVSYVVALGSSAVLDGSDPWLTPLDVVKRVHRAGLVETSTVMPPSAWLVRMLDAEMSASDIDQIKAEVSALRPTNIVPAGGDTAGAYQAAELAIAYNQYLIDEAPQGSADRRGYAMTLRSSQRASFPGLSLEAERFKNPLSTPQDSQVSAGVSVSDGKAYARFTFLPVSHALIDDNASYLSENELKLFELSLLRSLDGQRIKLDHLDIYSIGSYLPLDPMVGGTSAKFKVGVEQKIGKGFVPEQTFFVEGGVGRTRRVTRDLDVYGLIGVGALMRGGVGVYASPEVGAVIREVFDMKSVVSVARVWRSLSWQDPYWDLTLQHAKYLSSNSSLVASWRHQTDGRHVRNMTSLDWKLIF